MRDQFYLVLPSNSSMKYYPGNTVTRYTTQLPKGLKMLGDWVVALTEIQFPRTFLHIDDTNGLPDTAHPVTVARAHENIVHDIKYKSNSSVVPLNSTTQYTIEKHPNAKIHKATLPNGLYTSVKVLIDTINASEVFNGHIRFDYDENIGGLVSVKRIPIDCNVKKCKLPNVISIDDKLSRVLGFVPGVSMDIHKQSLFTAIYPANLSLAFPDKLFVYTDICENYITGDVQTPLLRIVPVDNTNYIYGTVQTKSFSPPMYIPLSRTEFGTVEIDIRTDTGKRVPFQSGTLTVTLHFKRVR